MPKKAHLTGVRFGRLLAESESSVRIGNRPTWICRCDCGTADILVTAKLLLSGGKKSCGCLKREVNTWVGDNSHNITHNMSKSSTYICWRNMKARCDDVNHQAYKRYGGAGVTYCKKWREFEGFLDDMGVVPDGLTLNRKDPNGSYNVENCEWVGKEQQAIDKKPHVDSSCPYKGVFFNKATNKYKAAFRGKHLGYSDDPYFLALIYDRKAFEETNSYRGTNYFLGLVNKLLPHSGGNVS